MLQGWLDGKSFPYDLSRIKANIKDAASGSNFVYQKLGKGFALYSTGMRGPKPANASASFDSIKSGNQYVVRFSG